MLRPFETYPEWLKRRERDERRARIAVAVCLVGGAAVAAWAWISALVHS